MPALSSAPRLYWNGWARFHLVRFEDLGAGLVDDDWDSTGPRPIRDIRLVVRKQP